LTVVSDDQRLTLPALMHEVQTLIRFGVPLTTVRTDWMLGYQRRGVRRCEWEIELPKPGRLPQMSQVAATGKLLQKLECGGQRNRLPGAQRKPQIHDRVFTRYVTLRPVGGAS
jgi:hypothetical protein